MVRVTVNMKKDQPMLPVSRTSIECVILLHSFFQDEKQIAAWLKLKNPNLGGMSPIQMIQMGKAPKLLQFIKNALDENKEEI